MKDFVERYRGSPKSCAKVASRSWLCVPARLEQSSGRPVPSFSFPCGQTLAGWSNSLIVFSTRLLPSSWNATIFGLVIGGILMDVRTSAQAQLVKGAGSNEQDRQETE